MKKLLTTLAAIVLFAGAAFAQPGSTNPVIPGGGGGTGTIGGTLGATDNVAVCSDGTGGVTAKACTQALFPLGSAGAPSISFNGDPNTGFYSTADSIFFATGGANRLQITTNNVVLGANVNLSGNGSQNLNGYLVQLYARTGGSGAPLAMPGSASSQWSTNEGATAEAYVTLPAAVTGVHYSACVNDADGFRYTASAGDTIRVIDKVTASAGYISSTTIGSCVKLVAVNSVEWFAASITGVWTDGTWTYSDLANTTP